MNIQNKSLCKIRTITSFISLDKDKNTWNQKIKEAAAFSASLISVFKKAGYKVQSIRIVTNPFGEYLDTTTLQKTLDDMTILSNILTQNQTDIRLRFAIGEAITKQEIDLIPDIIKHFGDIGNVCVNVKADKLGIPEYETTLQCAQTIKKIAQTTPDCDGNFNFTINYNCKVHIPYFPASYHQSHLEDCFAIGLETPDLLVKTLQNLPKTSSYNKNLHLAYEAMRHALQFFIDDISNIIISHKHPNKTKFIGFDSSAAPSKHCSSIVDIYKLLGVDYFGAASTVEVSALLTKVFQSLTNCNLIGFSGLMLALLEDEGLAQSSKKAEFDIRSLLTYSAVCGIGLDTVPIEGNTTVKKIANICQNTGIMAYKLNKPLTVRLFPIPNLKAGEITRFDSEDLYNAAVLAIP